MNLNTSCQIFFGPTESSCPLLWVWTPRWWSIGWNKWPSISLLLPGWWLCSHMGYTPQGARVNKIGNYTRIRKWRDDDHGDIEPPGTCGNLSEDKNIYVGFRLGIQADFVHLKGHTVMFGHKSIKITKELPGTQPRVQFLPVLVGKVKEPDLPPVKWDQKTLQILPTPSNAGF